MTLMDVTSQNKINVNTLTGKYYSKIDMFKATNGFWGAIFEYYKAINDLDVEMECHLMENHLREKKLINDAYEMEHNHFLALKKIEGKKKEAFGALAYINNKFKIELNQDELLKDYLQKLWSLIKEEKDKRKRGIFLKLRRILYNNLIKQTSNTGKDSIL